MFILRQLPRPCYVMLNVMRSRPAHFTIYSLRNEEIFVQLDEFDRITHA